MVVIVVVAGATAAAAVCANTPSISFRSKSSITRRLFLFDASEDGDGDDVPVDLPFFSNDTRRLLSLPLLPAFISRDCCCNCCCGWIGGAVRCCSENDGSFVTGVAAGVAAASPITFKAFETIWSEEEFGGFCCCCCSEEEGLGGD